MFKAGRKNSGKKRGRERSMPPSKGALIEQYLKNGSVPWSKGYREYKMQLIADTLSDPSLIKRIGRGDLPSEFGVGVDERSVEYPWAIAHLLSGAGPVFDAGSALNFDELAELPLWENRPLTIGGLSVEKKCFYSKGISYQFCDLRNLPFKDGWFEDVASISTLEHIGMDNSIYGHENEQSGEVRTGVELKTREFVPAVREIRRVTAKGGRILITVPVGRYEHHGFFQQFDEELIELLKRELEEHGAVSEQYFRYLPNGWQGCEWSDCSDSQSHNPNTGAGKGDDGAAHCRAIGCFIAQGKG